MLNEFYAVTMTSVYRAWVDENQFPRVQKIVQRAGTESNLKVGDCLGSQVLCGRRATLLAITKDGVELFCPRREGDRNPHMLTGIYRGGNTSPIVALFRAQAKAMECLGAGALVPRDARFASQTNEVLTAIGLNHLVFCVCV